LIASRLLGKRYAETAVTKEVQSKKIYEDVVRKMESRYHIELKIDFPVEMVEPDRMAEILGESFTPTDDFDPRTVGLVDTANDKSTMYVEAGAPRIALIGTFAHELAHICRILYRRDGKTGRLPRGRPGTSRSTSSAPMTGKGLRTVWKSGPRSARTFTHEGGEK